METRRIRAGDVNLNVLLAGAETAPPLLLLHGIGGTAYEWMGVVPRFAEHYRVIAADAPGHGFSDKPRGGAYNVDYYVDAILGLMGALGIDMAPVVAVSGGGAVAVALVLAAPQRVSKLVLVSSAGLGREVALHYRLSGLPLSAFLFRRGLSRKTSESFGRALCYHRDRLPAGWVDRRMAIWATQGSIEAFFTTVRANLSLAGQRVEYSRRLREIQQPTLLVWGRQDPIIPVAHGLRAAKLLMNARLHVFEQCGHMPFWEYPDEFAQIVLDFLGHDEHAGPTR